LGGKRRRRRRKRITTTMEDGWMNVVHMESIHNLLPSTHEG
jgi:hypothetical protein